MACRVVKRCMEAFLVPQIWVTPSNKHETTPQSKECSDGVLQVEQMQGCSPVVQMSSQLQSALLTGNECQLALSTRQTVFCVANDQKSHQTIKKQRPGDSRYSLGFCSSKCALGNAQ